VISWLVLVRAFPSAACEAQLAVARSPTCGIPNARAPAPIKMHLLLASRLGGDVDSLAHFTFPSVRKPQLAGARVCSLVGVGGGGGALTLLQAMM
jgi:hypothetical protein